MITPTLEKAMIAGKARLRTHTHAFVPVSKIEVPDNCFVIVTDVKISPFTNFAARAGFDLKASDFDLVSTAVVELTNQDSEKAGFVVRNNYEILTDPTGQQYVKNSEPVHFDTYLVRSKDIYVQVGMIPGYANASTVNYDTMLNTQSPGGANGYAGQSILLNFSKPPASGSVGFYSPTGFPDGRVQPSVGSSVYSEAAPDYNNIFCQVLKNQPIWNNLSPVVQVQYVVINEQVIKDFQ